MTFDWRKKPVANRHAGLVVLYHVPRRQQVDFFTFRHENRRGADGAAAYVERGSAGWTIS